MTPADKGEVTTKARIWELIDVWSEEGAPQIITDEIDRLLDSLAAPAATTASAAVEQLRKAAMDASHVLRSYYAISSREPAVPAADALDVALVELSKAPAAGGDWAEAIENEIHDEMQAFLDGKPLLIGTFSEGYWHALDKFFLPLVRRHAKDAAGRGVGENPMRGHWRCLQCGERFNMGHYLGSDVRWAGDHWQHHHGDQVGHCDMERIDDPATPPARQASDELTGAWTDELNKRERTRPARQVAREEQSDPIAHARRWLCLLCVRENRISTADGLFIDYAASQAASECQQCGGAGYFTGALNAQPTRSLIAAKVVEDLRNAPNKLGAVAQLSCITAWPSSS